MLQGNRLVLALCCIAPLLISCAAVPCAQAEAPSSEPVFVADGLGLGPVALDGPWQFHLGDDIAWANPDLDDAAGQNGWERISATEHGSGLVSGVALKSLPQLHGQTGCVVGCARPVGE